MDKNYFWDEREMRESANPSPTILAIGDSWFWYPFPGGSLVNQLGDLTASRGQVIFANGMNGAEAFDYVDGKYASAVRNALRLYGSGLEAVFISGGGNDFAGFNDLRPLLKQDCSAETTADGCFAGGASGLQVFLDNMDTYYRKLIGVIYTYTQPGCKVVMHTYDYAIPDGKGVFGDTAWLKPALVDARVDVGLQQKCIAFLLDSFYAVLKDICSTDPQNLFVVDSRGTLKPQDWANELHPTPAGFAKIASQRWRPVLRQLGLAD